MSQIFAKKNYGHPIQKEFILNCFKMSKKIKKKASPYQRTQWLNKNYSQPAAKFLHVCSYSAPLWEGEGCPSLVTALIKSLLKIFFCQICPRVILPLVELLNLQA